MPNEEMEWDMRKKKDWGHTKKKKVKKGKKKEEKTVGKVGEEVKEIKRGKVKTRKKKREKERKKGKRPGGTKDKIPGGVKKLEVGLGGGPFQQNRTLGVLASQQKKHDHAGRKTGEERPFLTARKPEKYNRIKRDPGKGGI